MTLDLIEKLKTAKIGEESRLESMKDALMNGRTVYESDKKYHQKKFQLLEKNEEPQMNSETGKSDEKRLSTHPNTLQYIIIDAIFTNAK